MVIVVIFRRQALNLDPLQRPGLCELPLFHTLSKPNQGRHQAPGQIAHQSKDVGPLLAHRCTRGRECCRQSELSLEAKTKHTIRRNQVGGTRVAPCGN